MDVYRTGPKFEQPTFKCNFCSDFTARISKSASTHSHSSCELFKHDVQVLWVKLGQILQLKVGRLNFVRFQDSTVDTNSGLMMSLGELPLTPIVPNPNIATISNSQLWHMHFRPDSVIRYPVHPHSVLQRDRISCPSHHLSHLVCTYYKGTESAADSVCSAEQMDWWCVG